MLMPNGKSWCRTSKAGAERQKLVPNVKSWCRTSKAGAEQHVDAERQKLEPCGKSIVVNCVVRLK
jgi:hypothetical protein